MTEAVRIIILIALVAFAIEEFNAQGRALGWWGGILLCIALLWGSITEVL
jgi:drug/metabolite transporter superfamily protein YnfA